MLVLRLRRVPFIDMTGLLTLEEVIKALQKRGVHVILCDANALLKEKLAKAGILELVRDDNYADTLALALSRCRATLNNVTQHPVERRHARFHRMTIKHFLLTSQQYLFGKKKP